MKAICIGPDTFSASVLTSLALSLLITCKRINVSTFPQRAITHHCFLALRTYTSDVLCGNTDYQQVSGCSGGLCSELGEGEYQPILLYDIPESQCHWANSKSLKATN